MGKFLSMVLISGMPALMDETGRVVFSGMRVGITVTNSKSNRIDIWSENEWTLCGDEAEGEVRCASARIEYRREGRGMAMRSFYTNHGEPAERSANFIGLWGLWHCGFRKCLYNAITEENGLMTNEMRSQVVTSIFVDNITYSSAENVGLVDASGEQLIAGYISFEQRFPCVDAGDEGKLVFWQQMENHPIAKGETLEGDWLYLGLCDDITAGLVEYAELAGRYMNSRAGIFDTPYGYCTWYYYGRKLCPESVYENINTFRENRHRLDVKYFNLDNGWFKEWGDWSENEKFSCGMKKIADDIRAEGYLPGIWYAPFYGKTDTKMYAEHPDWFVKRWDRDEPMSEEGRLGLDMSHPEVKRYITETFRQASHEWGYRHIKIDLISDTLFPGRHYDPTFTALKNYREGLRLIREAITADTVLLACTAPMGPSIGYADGMRTSGDILYNWTCMKGLFNENLKRYYYNKTWFCTDPDCLLVRTAENEDEDCIYTCIRTDAENRTLATVIMASGGAMILSDKMPLLQEYQLKQLSYMYPINTRSAIPLDLMQSNVPGVLDLGRRQNTRIMALVNWTDAPKAMKVELEDGYVFEFWRQSYLGRRSGEVVFDIEPHGARVVFISDYAPIAAVGVNDCLCPELVQEWSAGELRGSFIKSGEKIYLAAEGAVEVVSGCEIATAQDGLYVITQTGEDLQYCVKLLF